MIQSLKSAFSFFAFAVCLTSALQADEALESITIASWNLEWFFDANKNDNESDIAKEQSSPDMSEWDWKRGAVAEAISKFRPTILCLQEIENRKVMIDLCDDLKKKYQLSYRVAFIEGFDRATEQDVAVIYQSGCVEFSRKEQTKEQFDSQQYYNLSKHLFARFEWQANGKTESLTILNVHFRAKAEESALRIRQAKLARLWLDKELQAGQNVIFVGDTNIEELYASSPAPGGELAELLGKNTTSQKDDMVETMVSFQKLADELISIWTSNLTGCLSANRWLRMPDRKGLVPESATVLSQVNIRGKGPDADHWDTRFTKGREERDISDHHPIMATFKFR